MPITLDFDGTEATISDDGVWTSAVRELAEALSLTCSIERIPSHVPYPPGAAADMAVMFYGAKIVSVDLPPTPDDPEDTLY
jgi:hypothetical protein